MAVFLRKLFYLPHKVCFRTQVCMWIASTQNHRTSLFDYTTLSMSKTESFMPSIVYSGRPVQ